MARKKAAATAAEEVKEDVVSVSTEDIAATVDAAKDSAIEEAKVEAESGETATAIDKKHKHFHPKKKEQTLFDLIRNDNAKRKE